MMIMPLGVMVHNPSINKVKPVLASSRYTSKDVLLHLSARCLYVGRVNTTVDTLLKLELSKYEQLLKFFDWIHARMEAGRIPQLKVIAPFFARKLQAVDLAHLMSTRRSRETVIQQCYLPERGRLDLRPLVFVNKLYPSQP